MSIIATVGRRSFGAMTLIVSMYLLLTIGGISMVYPFLLMLATATTTPSDMQEYRVIPHYYYDDNALYRKYLWLRYDTGLGGASARDYNRAYHKANVSAFRLDEYFGWGDPDQRSSLGLALPSDVDPNDPDVARRTADLDRFCRESAALWPGPPLTETIADKQTGRTRVDYVRDPYGQPLDPGGLTTGLGNRYRTVGYIGSVYVGFSGPGRDEWTRFTRQFYTHPDRPDESEVARLSRLIERQGRPYERWRQVRPGYDIPTMVSWGLIEGEYLQTDWLYYKAVWLGGAPIVEAGDGHAGISAAGARAIGQDPAEAETCTDVLGRTHRWTRAKSPRSIRPTRLMPDFWQDLKSRHMTIDQFNLAIGLARLERPGAGGPRPSISAAGRDVLLAKTVDLSAWGGPAAVPESNWLAMIRFLLTPRSGRQPSGGQMAPPTSGPGDGEPGTVPAADDPAQYHYLLPPEIDLAWSKLTHMFGVGPDQIRRLNQRIEAVWLSRLRTRGYRAVHLDAFEDFDQVYLSSRRPIYEPLAKEWDQFVAAKVPPVMIQPIARDPTRQPAAPGPTGGEVATRPDPSAPGQGDKAERKPPGFDPQRDHLRLPAHGWRDFLGHLYAGRDAEFRRLYLPGKSEQQVAHRVRLGKRLYGLEYAQFSLAPMPIADRDVVEFGENKWAMRRHFIFGNFRVVLDELVLEGRAMFNTIVLIFLAIGTHVTVNPLAAYALSRFRLAYTYKVLLFMLATMAFPPAVGMIPGFLLLKHLGLINTYAALVLPGIASGYTIFLLKGFFDALPQELYEAAEIDGAGKITTFLNVTFPLSKPIFAIITLQSFTAAYSGFMWAFLICPDSKMWTVMVHLFNIQQLSTPPIAMAALVIAAVPTFLVFLFCQNVILRGIIIPSFK